MIQDFGEKIHGAAKDRWQEYRLRLDLVADRDITSKPLSEVFPEPNYERELREGASPIIIGFIRAAREGIGRKPSSGTREVQKWANNVRLLRDFCKSILDGRIDEGRILEVIRQHDPNDALLMKIRAYERLGHSKSLRDYNMGSKIYRTLDGVTLNPPERRFICQNKMARLQIIEKDADAMIDRLGEHLSTYTPAARRTKPVRFQIYNYRHSPDVHWLGVRMGKGFLNLKSFDSATEAKSFFNDHYEELLALYERRRAAPPERGTENAMRSGPDRRDGSNVSPEAFMRTFGFRGVQFGNYVEGPRRQQDLNNAFDALMDLAEVLGCEPHALSIGGRLGLAFGARGRGGRNGGAAHYEPLHVVINLTKGSGAGSLAHEWGHAVDNLIGRLGAGAGAFATTMGVGNFRNLTWEDRNAIDALGGLMQRFRNTAILERSEQADKFRTSRYFSQPEEVMARSFEAWVVRRLSDLGIRNDYLANFLGEKEFALIEGDLTRYPYPLETEMGEVTKAYDAIFEAGGALSMFLGGTDPELAVERSEEVARTIAARNDPPVRENPAERPAESAVKPGGSSSPAPLPLPEPAGMARSAPRQLDLFVDYEIPEGAEIDFG